MPNPMIGVRVPPEWLSEIEAIAKARGISVADVAREAIAAYLEKTDISDIKQHSEVDIIDIKGDISTAKQALQADISDIKSDIANIRTGIAMLTERVKQFEQGVSTATPQPSKPGKVTLENFTPQDIQLDSVPELDAAIAAPVPPQFQAPAPKPKGKESWLTLPDAFELAKSRGYQGPTTNAFRSWAKRNPDLLQGRFGLRWHGAGSKDSKSPSYEDVGVRE